MSFVTQTNYKIFNTVEGINLIICHIIGLLPILTKGLGFIFVSSAVSFHIHQLKLQLSYFFFSRIYQFIRPSFKFTIFCNQKEKYLSAENQIFLLHIIFKLFLLNIFSHLESQVKVDLHSF